MVSGITFRVFSLDTCETTATHGIRTGPVCILLKKSLKYDICTALFLTSYNSRVFGTAGEA